MTPESRITQKSRLTPFCLQARDQCCCWPTRFQNELTEWLRAHMQCNITSGCNYNRLRMWIAAEIIPRAHASLSEQRPLEAERPQRMTVMRISRSIEEYLNWTCSVEQSLILQGFLPGVCALCHSRSYMANRWLILVKIEELSEVILKSWYYMN